MLIDKITDDIQSQTGTAFTATNHRVEQEILQVCWHADTVISNIDACR